MCGETFTKPRSSSTPAVSSPSPATFAARPTAMRTRSTSSCSPPRAPTTPGPRPLRRPAHGHEDPLDLELLAAEVDDDARAAGLHRRHLDAGLHGDPATGEGPRQLLRDVLVLDGHHARERLEQRYLDAVRRIDVGELDPDRAGADDGDRARRRLAPHRAVRRDDCLLVDGEARQGLRLR